MRLRFQILGPLEVHGSTGRIPLTGTKIHTVLAALLLAEGEVVSDGRISSLLWGGDPPATADAQIYTNISRLRKVLGPGVAIERRWPGYRIDAQTVDLDYRRFASLSAAGHRQLQARRFEAASASFHEALALWKGSALCSVTDFMTNCEAPRLHETRLSVVDGRITADLELGRHAELVSELRLLVDQHPLRELLRSQLMRALHRCGRRGEAVETFHQGRRILDDELGVGAGALLNEAYAEIIRERPAQAPPAGAHPLPPLFQGALRSMAGRALLPEEVLRSLVAAKFIRPTRHGVDGRVRYVVRTQADPADAAPSVGSPARPRARADMLAQTTSRTSATLTSTATEAVGRSEGRHSVMPRSGPGPVSQDAA